jgi:hypothetical protein
LLVHRLKNFQRIGSLSRAFFLGYRAATIDRLRFVADDFLTALLPVATLQGSSPEEPYQSKFLKVAGKRVDQTALMASPIAENDAGSAGLSGYFG